MKNIISLVVLMSSILIAQTSSTKSLAELKQATAISHQLSAVSNQQSAISNHTPDIQNPQSQKKNPALAILYSMILPGMGELYANGYESGKYFTIADGVLWGTFTGFDLYGNWQAKNYKSFAESKAGAKLDNKDSEYFANIGIYQSLDEYNSVMELDRNFEKVYNPATHYWNWSNPDQRKEYRNMWTSSEAAYTNVRFVVGALILNRVISAINAVRLVAAYNKNLPKELSWNVYFNIENRQTIPQTITLNFVSKL
ncbi:MAG: hypothetical protein NTX65_17800 [Ignavibacteriales bacterium]|nr:hypothetical protein [Ignavibacteriales bacterium]